MVQVVAREMAADARVGAGVLTEVADASAVTGAAMVVAEMMAGPAAEKVWEAAMGEDLVGVAMEAGTEVVLAEVE